MEGIDDHDDDCDGDGDADDDDDDDDTLFCSLRSYAPQCLFAHASTRAVS